jgi:hypothetical protein
MKKRTKERCALIFGEEMKSCPKCGSYELRTQTPIKLETEDADFTDPRRLIGKWAKAHKGGKSPMLEGHVFLMCFDCGHKGPAVDCTGRTSADVGKDKVVYAEIKRLWNDQPND